MRAPDPADQRWANLSHEKAAFIGGLILIDKFEALTALERYDAAAVLARRLLEIPSFLSRDRLENEPEWAGFRQSQAYADLVRQGGR